MNIKPLIEQINNLKAEVQRRTQAYLTDTEYISIVDNQLNGYLKALNAFCATNNLSNYAQEISNFLPIERNAIEFFCFFDGIADNLIATDNLLAGRARINVIHNIAVELQQSMTKYNIDSYLSNFGISIPENLCAASKRVYVEQLLSSVDSLIVVNIAEDLGVFSCGVIETEIADKLSNDFLNQQINKCKMKINTKDYDGARTNARTLIEEVLLSLEERLLGVRQSYDGKLGPLYSRVSKLIHMSPDRNLDNDLNKILTGFISISSGFAGISNTFSDRHATTKHPSLHHAKFAVNSALVFCEFLIDSYQYQNKC